MSVLVTEPAQISGKAVLNVLCGRTAGTEQHFNSTKTQNVVCFVYGHPSHTYIDQSACAAAKVADPCTLLMQISRPLDRTGKAFHFLNLRSIIDTGVEYEMRRIDVFCTPLQEVATDSSDPEMERNTMCHSQSCIANTGGHRMKPAKRNTMSV